MNFEDIRHIDQVQVQKSDRTIGTCTRTPHGAVFEYAKDPDADLSFCMPRSNQRFEVTGVNLHPFFAGLLPEGLRLQTLVQHTKTSPDDLFSLLVAAGTDTVGDVSLCIEGQMPTPHTPAVDLDRLGKHSFKELFQKSLAFDSKACPDLQPSLPGVQDKISAGLSFPVRGRKKACAHILKLESKRQPRLIHNEAFFMTMARACGLEVPKVRMVADRHQKNALLVERFDRLADAQARRFAKVHVEDACQFTDRYPADKYRLSMAQVAQGLLDYASAPQVQILRLIELAAFSYLIGNGDLHAKNISLVVDPNTHEVRLSPVYDLVSTLPYGDRSMALKIDGRDSKLGYQNFVNFGARFGLRKKAIESMLQQLAQKAEPFIQRLDEIGLSDKKTADLVRTIKQRMLRTGHR